ncbi:hypothetical protein AAHE18_13G215200 [Arachis hypogaea]
MSMRYLLYVIIENHVPKLPLWMYVKILTKNTSVGGGNKNWQCNFCDRVFIGSYSRVKAHLLKIAGIEISACKKVNANYLIELKKIDEESTKAYERPHVPLPSENRQVTPIPSASSTTFDLTGKKRKVGPLEKAFNNEERAQLTELIARMFYSSGLPFHFARNPYYMSSYTFAASHAISGYIPPGYNALRTTLLQKEKENVERMLQPIKSLWSSKGVTIVADGWTDTQRRPLVNFMAISEGGPIFLKAVDGSLERNKDRFYMARLFKEAIKEVGVQNVVQIITDNASVCKAAGLLIEQDYDNIFWTPCVVHTLNLALKNICAAKNTEKNEVTYVECHWITEVRDDAVFIKIFIMNHSMRLAIFNVFVPLKLLSIAETRFASTIVMLKRFKLIKQALQEMVISQEWNTYRHDDQKKAATVKGFILDDLWWDKIDYIINFTNPIYEVLRICDTDSPTLHLVYDMWDTMIVKVKEIIYRHEGNRQDEHSSFYEVVYSILIDRWTKSSTPLHCMAHSLNPRYYSPQWLQEAPNRVAPHQDEEISMERNKCLRRYFPDIEDRKKVALEFSKFSTFGGVFSSFDSIADRWELDPQSWWSNYGSSAPLLQMIALKLLVQPSSSSCSERNWSTYSFIHSKRRNKLNPSRAEDLVYVHTNLRLLSRMSEDYKKGDTSTWDVRVDDNSPDLSEVSYLSLDEPNIEAVVFTDDGLGGEEIDTFLVSEMARVD